MKLQKQLFKKTEKRYYRYSINISEELVTQAGLKEGSELEGEASKGEIRLKRK
jgi:hypothetical protein